MVARFHRVIDHIFERNPPWFIGTYRDRTSFAILRTLRFPKQLTRQPEYFFSHRGKRFTSIIMLSLCDNKKRFKSYIFSTL